MRYILAVLLILHTHFVFAEDTPLFSRVSLGPSMKVTGGTVGRPMIDFGIGWQSDELWSVDMMLQMGFSSRTNSASVIEADTTTNDLMIGPRWIFPFLGESTNIGLFGGYARRSANFSRSTASSAGSLIVGGDSYFYGTQLGYRFNDVLGIQAQYLRIGDATGSFESSTRTARLNVTPDDYYNLLLEVKSENLSLFCVSDDDACKFYIAFVVLSLLVAGVLFLATHVLLWMLGLKDGQWNRFSVGSSAVYNQNLDADGRVKELQRGLAHSFRMASGSDSFPFGFSLEAGQLNRELVDNESNTKTERTSTYGLVGPRLNLWGGSVYFDALAGVTDNSAYRFMGLGRFGFYIPISSAVEIGFDAGAVYLDEKFDEPVDDRQVDKFNFTTGLQLGLVL